MVARIHAFIQYFILNGNIYGSSVKGRPYGSLGEGGGGAVVNKLAKNPSLPRAPPGEAYK